MYLSLLCTKSKNCSCEEYGASIFGTEQQLTPVQSSKLLLALASTVFLGFGPRWNPWLYIFVLFRLLRVLKWGLLFEKRRGPVTPPLLGVTLLSLTLTHFHSLWTQTSNTSFLLWPPFRASGQQNLIDARSKCQWYMEGKKRTGADSQPMEAVYVKIMDSCALIGSLLSLHMFGSVLFSNILILFTFLRFKLCPSFLVLRTFLKLHLFPSSDEKSRELPNSMVSQTVARDT
jgi:hypothetical protein